jgi:hypothetical protein
MMNGTKKIMRSVSDRIEFLQAIKKIKAVI